MTEREAQPEPQPGHLEAVPDALREHLEALTERIERLETTVRRRSERIETLEAELADRDRRIERLEARVEDQAAQLENQRADLETHGDQLEAHETTLETHEATLETHEATLETCRSTLETQADRLEAHETTLETHTSKLTTVTSETEAAIKKANANKRRIRELQARELEKGAHLRTTTVDPAELELRHDHLEKVAKDDGRTYYRVPDRDDPLERTETTLAHGDLLPIQQLARLDEDMRRSTTSALPTRLAAALWEARTDPTVGDDPWERGCTDIKAHVTASDLKHWIRRQEEGISETYAKKLVSRTIDAALELSNNRLAVRKRTQRKNGLEYTERRLILPANAEIPGETGSDSSPHQDGDDSSATATRTPETADVHG